MPRWTEAFEDRGALPVESDPHQETILEEASRIVDGDRQDAYGHPLFDFTRTAALWSAALGFSVTAQQVAICMILVKVSRECNRHGRDNLVDVAGYARTLEMVHEACAESSREPRH